VARRKRDEEDDGDNDDGDNDDEGECDDEWEVLARSATAITRQTDNTNTALRGRPMRLETLPDHTYFTQVRLNVAGAEVTIKTNRRFCRPASDDAEYLSDETSKVGSGHSLKGSECPCLSRLRIVGEPELPPTPERRCAKRVTPAATSGEQRFPTVDGDVPSAGAGRGFDTVAVVDTRSGHLDRTRRTWLNPVRPRPVPAHQRVRIDRGRTRWSCRQRGLLCRKFSQSGFIGFSIQPTRVS